MEALPDVMGKLDCRISQGNKTIPVWQKRVTDALSVHPEFVIVGKRGRASIYQYDATHTAPAKRNTAKSRDKGKFMG